MKFIRKIRQIMQYLFSYSCRLISRNIFSSIIVFHRGIMSNRLYVYCLIFPTLLQVNGFPTLNIYKNGEKIEEFNGRRELSDLEDFVNKHLASKDEL